MNLEPQDWKGGVVSYDHLRDLQVEGTLMEVEVCPFSLPQPRYHRDGGPVVPSGLLPPPYDCPIPDAKSRRPNPVPASGRHSRASRGLPPLPSEKEVEAPHVTLFARPGLC